MPKVPSILNAEILNKNTIGMTGKLLGDSGLQGQPADLVVPANRKEKHH